MTLLLQLLFRLARIRLLRPLAGRLISHLSGRALADATADLRRALPGFPEAAKNLERRYLDLGVALEELAHMAGELVGASRHVVVLSSGHETGEADFDRTLAILGSPLEYLGLALAELPEVAASLGRASALAGKLVALEQALEQTLAPLRFTQLMFSVESAALSDQARESFGALTCQIGALHQRVQVSIRRHFDGLVETRNSLSRAAAELDRFSRTRLSDLKQGRERISATLGSLADEVRENARRDVQLTSASDAMAAEVNRAVTAMQTEDIVAQKLDHAARGLADVAATYTEIHCRDGIERLHRVSTVARIELGQLDAVLAELTRSQFMLAEAVSGIEARLKEMDDRCLMLHEFENITASVDGAAQMLIDSLAGVREMTGDTLRITGRLEEILRPVESAADIVTGSVSEVAAEIHRIALNAQVHAVQTGARTGLEVLAEHIASLAGDTMRINAQLCAGLAESVREMTASTARLARLRVGGEEALRVCNQDASREEASLHGFRDRVLQEMHRVGALLDNARQKGAGMVAMLNFEASRQHIQAARGSVEKLALAAEALIPSASATKRYAEAGVLARRYTMASERQVHRKVLEKLAPAASIPSAEPPSGSGASIELF